MILAIDIGNSTVGFGFVSEGEVRKVVKFENMPDSELFSAKLTNFLESSFKKESVNEVIVCSVVPQALAVLKRSLRSLKVKRPYIVGANIGIPIANKYHSPDQVGKDRLLCAFAARELYGAPAIVIDLGTAITFDGISRKGEYLGGVIIPGIRISAEALFEKTALLPRVNIAVPKKVIGESTEESIQSGIFHGFGALCDGMIERLGDEMKCKPAVVMTGGYALAMKSFMRCQVHAVDEDLIFRGMSLILSSAGHVIRR